MGYKVPFITMLYEYKGKRKKFECDFPEQFIKAFKDEKEEDYYIGYFFIIAKLQPVKTLQDAMKICIG